MNKITTLNELKPGERAFVREIKSTDGMHRRLLDIGMIENTPVECIGISPMGDPCAYLIRGAVIAIREDDGKNIYIDGISGGLQGWD